MRTLKNTMYVMAMLLSMASSAVLADSEVIDGVTWYYRYDSRIPIQVRTGDAYSYTYADGAVIIAGEKPYRGDLVVPTSLGGHSVRSIGAYAFDNCRGLLSVSIPACVSVIQQDAFRGCAALRAVIMCEGVVDVGAGAFSGCTNLRAVVIPSSVAYVGPSAFENCARLCSVSLLSNASVVGKNAFAGCGSLRELSLPPGEMTIDGCAFKRCLGLADYDGFVIVKGSLQDYAGESPFVAIPAGVTSIGEKAFQGRNDILTVSIPGGVTRIGESAFDGCCQMQAVDLPGSLTYVCHYAFRGCCALREIVIPKDLKIIEWWTFRGCTGLERIAVEEGNPYYRAENGCLISTQNQYHPYSDGSKLVLTRQGELLAAVVSNGSVDVPSGVLVLGQGVFAGCIKLGKVTLPEGLQKIDFSAFEGCRGIRSLTIPKTVSTIEIGVFDGCSSLEHLEVEAGNPNFWSGNNCIVSWYGRLCAAATASGVVDIPVGVTIVDNLNGCCELRRVNVPEGVRDVSLSAFEGCRSLEQVTFPSTLVNIYDSFKGCLGLTEMNVPDGVELLNYGSFAQCSNLKRLSIPASVNFISSETVRECPRLETLTIDEANQTFRSENNCIIRRGMNDLITGAAACGDLVVPDGVNSIEMDAFVNATSLTSVRIPGTVNRIGALAFYNCTSLTNIDLRTGVGMIEVGAFAGCVNLTSLHLPRSVHGMMEDAFRDCPLSDITIEHGSCFALLEDRTIRDYRGEVVYEPICNAKVLRATQRASDSSILDVTYEVRASYSNVDVRVLAYLDGADWRHVVRPAAFVPGPDGMPSSIGPNVPVNREVTFSWKVSDDVDLRTAANVKIKIFANPIGMPDDVDTEVVESDETIPFESLTDERLDDMLGWLYAYGREDLILKDGVLCCADKTLVSGKQLFVDDVVGYLGCVMGKSFLQRCRPGIASAFGAASTRLTLSGAVVDGNFTNLFSASYSDCQVVPYVADVTGDGFWDLIVVAGNATNLYVRQHSAETVAFVTEKIEDWVVPQGVWLSNSVDAVTLGMTLDPSAVGAVSASHGVADELFVAWPNGSIWLYKGSALVEKDWGGMGAGSANGLMLAAVDWDSDGDTDCIYGTADGKLGILIDPRPARISGLKTRSGIDSVLLSWNPVLQSRVSGYRVYQDDDRVATVSVPCLLDKNILPGWHSYCVSTLSRFYVPGNSEPIVMESELSDPVSARVGDVMFRWSDPVKRNDGKVAIRLLIENSFNFDAKGLQVSNVYDNAKLEFLKVEPSGLSEKLTWVASDMASSVKPNERMAVLTVTGGEVAPGRDVFFTFLFDDLTVERKVLLGDLDGDGDIDKDDVRLLAQLKNAGRKWTANQLKAGDFNGNGILDNADYQALRDLLKEKGLL